MDASSTGVITKLPLKAARVYVGLSATQAAEKLGFSRSTLSMIENGHMIPSRAQLIAMSSVYGLPVEMLDSPERVSKL